MSLTTFRQTVADTVGNALGIPPEQRVDGKLEGPLEQGPILCSWSEVVREKDEVDLEEVEVLLRVLLPYVERTDPAMAIDPAPLEEIVETIQTSLRDVETTAGPSFGFRPVLLTIDVDARRVTALLVGTQFNPFIC